MAGSRVNCVAAVLVFDELSQCPIVDTSWSREYHDFRVNHQERIY